MQGDQAGDGDDRPGSGEEPAREAGERAETAVTPAGAAREQVMRVREASMDARETAASARELSLSEREELARLRDQALRAGEEAREAEAAREHLMAQMREANEKLVLATLRADQMADEANAARLRIAQSEERFRSLVMTAAAVLFQADARGSIRVDPESFCAFTGLEAAQVTGAEAGRGWREAIHPDDRKLFDLVWRRAVAAGETFTRQHRLRRRDGSHAWVVSRAVPLPGKGAVREWIGTMTDVSDRVRIEEAREQFIAILGHDLGSPLAAISLGVQSLTRESLSHDDVSKLAGWTQESVQRMRAMIRDMLDFARGRLGGGIPVQRRPGDLGQLCEKQVRETSQANPGRAITCETIGDLQGDWDAARMAQVLSNLITNAVEHGGDPIAVTARGAGDEVLLSVHNEGAPIPARTLPVLFEPFHRDDDSKGLGLGLFIVSEIVRAHGGTIAVASTAAEGTTFTIRCPRRAPDPA